MAQHIILPEDLKLFVKVPASLETGWKRYVQAYLKENNDDSVSQVGFGHPTIHAVLRTFMKHSNTRISKILPGGHIEVDFDMQIKCFKRQGGYWVALSYHRGKLLHKVYGKDEESALRGLKLEAITEAQEKSLA